MALRSDGTVSREDGPRNVAILPGCDVRNSENIDSHQQKIERTREGLTQADLALSYAITNETGKAYLPKPTLDEMVDFVDRQETTLRASVFTVSLINGFVDTGQARQLAIARKLIDFLALCIEHEDELALMLRAKAHSAGRRP